jgi:broad specificity phosphatase PhoE
MTWRFERVYLVRHGETEWNREGRRQGQLDSPLTPEGEKHAVAMGRFVASLPVDAVLCSPLGRAHRTALIIADRIGHAVQVLPDLAEIHHGAFAGMTSQEIDSRYPGVLQQRESDKYNWPFPGGESYRHGAARAHSALEQALTHGFVYPLLVTHEMIGRLLLAALLELEPHAALARDLPHGYLYEVLRSNGWSSSTSRVTVDRSRGSA